MTITFYLGPDYKEITKKFDIIVKHYKSNSNSDCFRKVVRLLHKEITRVNGK